MRYLKDPLIHFLAIGLVLFAVYAALNPVSGPNSDPKRIVVDRDALLTFLQYRTKTFQPKLAAARLDGMAPERLGRLVDDYVREEALYREARALGLARNDYIIKRRMIQKVDFITQGFAEAAAKVSDEDIAAYYVANKERYSEPAVITFTHVFFDARGRGPEAARKLAAEELVKLQEGGVAFANAPKYGERFAYGVNFVERSSAYIASRFGKQMQAALFALGAEDGRWHGPLQSPAGSHLVMVIGNRPTRIPPLEEVRPRIVADIKQRQVRERSEQAVEAIVKTYTVDIAVDGKAGKTLAGLERKP